VAGPGFVCLSLCLNTQELIRLSAPGVTRRSRFHADPKCSSAWSSPVQPEATSQHVERRYPLQQRNENSDRGSLEEVDCQGLKEEVSRLKGSLIRLQVLGPLLTHRPGACVADVLTSREKAIEQQSASLCYQKQAAEGLQQEISVLKAGLIEKEQEMIALKAALAEASLSRPSGAGLDEEEARVRLPRAVWCTCGS
jgi:hypothetical protein